jgi:hypothetical protein
MSALKIFSSNMTAAAKQQSPKYPVLSEYGI